MDCPLCFILATLPQPLGQAQGKAWSDRASERLKANGNSAKLVRTTLPSGGGVVTTSVALPGLPFP
jgi:hypothetical protein